MACSSIKERIYVVGDNIDTDQIIPACYLTRDIADLSTRHFLGSKALSGLPSGSYSVPFVEPRSGSTKFRIIVAGQNFGCGSSREQAVLAIADAGVKAVVAQSFGRIFFRNCVATGALYPFEVDACLPELHRTGDVAKIDIKRQIMTIGRTEITHSLRLRAREAAVIAAGGLFAHARQQDLLSKEPGSRR
jgi:3-isopropylmalate/(R)-2-methylmalate dehydratase small subunit